MLLAQDLPGGTVTPAQAPSLSHEAVSNEGVKTLFTRQTFCRLKERFAALVGQFGLHHGPLYIADLERLSVRNIPLTHIMLRQRPLYVFPHQL